MTVFALGLIVGIAAYHIGRHVADSDRLRRLGFTKRTRDRYLDAIDILNGLVNINRLDGDFSADLLSDKTKARIARVLAAHRKDIEDSNEPVA